METKFMKPSEVLRKYGWKQRAYGDITTGFCLVGAIFHVYWGDNYAQNVLHRIESRIAPCIPLAWNDQNGRKVEEVIALLESIGE